MVKGNGLMVKGYALNRICLEGKRGGCWEETRSGIVARVFGERRDGAVRGLSGMGGGGVCPFEHVGILDMPSRVLGRRCSCGQGLKKRIWVVEKKIGSGCEKKGYVLGLKKRLGFIYSLVVFVGVGIR